jgi:hypothetical protein
MIQVCWRVLLGKKFPVIARSSAMRNDVAIFFFMKKTTPPAPR